MIWKRSSIFNTDSIENLKGCVKVCLAKASLANLAASTRACRLLGGLSCLIVGTMSEVAYLKFHVSRLAFHHSTIFQVASSSPGSQLRFPL